MLLYHQLVASLSKQLLPSNYVKLCDSVWKDNCWRNSSDCFFPHMQRATTPKAGRSGRKINIEGLLPPEMSAVYQCRNEWEHGKDKEVEVEFFLVRWYKGSKLSLIPFSRWGGRSKCFRAPRRVRGLQRCPQAPQAGVLSLRVRASPQPAHWGECNVPEPSLPAPLKSTLLFPLPEILPSYVSSENEIYHFYHFLTLPLAPLQSQPALASPASFFGRKECVVTWNGCVGGSRGPGKVSWCSCERTAFYVPSEAWLRVSARGTNDILTHGCRGQGAPWGGLCWGLAGVAQVWAAAWRSRELVTFHIYNSISFNTP